VPRSLLHKNMLLVICQLLQTPSASFQVEIDVEAEVRDAEAREAREASAAAAEELRKFDALLAERERQRQIEQGMRWKP
jgi:hypothetical protein